MEVEQLHSNDPLVLVKTKKDSRNDETTKNDLMKMKQEPVRSEEGRDISEKIAAPGGYTFETVQLPILPSSDRKELRFVCKKSIYIIFK